MAGKKNFFVYNNCVWHMPLILLLFPLSFCEAQDCTENVTSCIALPSTMTGCLGTSFPATFTHTSLQFATDASSLSEVEEKLKLWSGLQAAPKCWEVIQPFLCSVYLPKCDDATKTVELPSKELCKKTRDPCDIVETIKGWPDFLQCSQSFYSESCQSHTYDVASFNKSGVCNAPLIRTDNEKSWYEDIEGCGIQCQNPLFTDEEHQEVHTFIAVFGSLCLASTLFTILTFLIDWKTASRYPALILFFINICFFLGSIGWMAQFSGDARTDIVCKADGTIRKGEPELGSGETVSCTFVFIIVYYFLMAGVMWFVMLAYAWHLTFRALGTARDDLSNKTSYFHIASWCIPLVLTIICLAVSEVDGDSVSGICFVGAFNNAYRGGFLLTPIGLVLVVGMFFLILVLRTLIKLKKDTPEYISMKASAKIKETIIRLGIFTILAFVFVLTTFAVHLYIFTNEDSWADSFKEYLFCEANVTVTKSISNTSTVTCGMSSRPSIVAYEIHIFAFFGAGIAMSSWSWTKSSLLAWERFLRKIFKKPSNKPTKLKKHKIIAKAFEKRKELNNGRLSISFASTHDDPLGMKFDLNSMSSQNSMSSDFRAAMPKLVRRRGGMMLPTAGTLRRYSDSDIGSVISKMASRRQSLDSQISAAQGQFQMSEEENEIEYRENKRKRRKKKKKRRGKGNRIQPILAPISNAMSSVAYGGRRAGRSRRRGSDNSVGSRASAHGVELALEKNSMEAVSITSYSHQNSLDAATLPEPPKHLHTNFAIFTASSYMGEVSAKLQDIESTDKSEREGPAKATIEREDSKRKSSQKHHSPEKSKQERSRRHKEQINGRYGTTLTKGERTRGGSASRSVRQGSGSSTHGRGRQDSANSTYSRGRSRDVTLEMATTSYNERTKTSSATSRTSQIRQGSGRSDRTTSSRSSQMRQGSARSDRTNSAKSDRSIARQLPGETTVVEIEDHDNISLASD